MAKTTYDYKYYVIKRGVNGKLFDVWGEDLKRDVYTAISEEVVKGYQITVVDRLVMMTADNLDEERAKLGLPKYL